MRRFFEQLMVLFGLKRKISVLSQKIDAIQTKNAKVIEDLRVALGNAEKSKEVFSRELDKLREMVTQYKTETRDLNETIDALRQQLTTAEQITIPGLVSANRVLLERYEADIRIQAIRAHVAAPPQGE